MRRLLGWWLSCLVLVGGLAGCVQFREYTPDQDTQVIDQPVKPVNPSGNIAIFESDFKKIQNGMTADQVTALIGKPWRTIPPQFNQKRLTYWHYKVLVETVEIDGEIEFEGTQVTNVTIF